jgi:hypothetical protein
MKMLAILCQNIFRFERGSSLDPIHKSPHRRILKYIFKERKRRMSDFTSTLKSRVSALAENARDLTLDFEAATGSRFFDNDDQTMKEVQTLLGGRLDREKLEALRRLVAVYSSSMLMSLL